MLTEQRYEIILNLLEKKRSVTAAELKDVLKTSESTVRRDITALDKQGRLTKVFGGAVAQEHVVTVQEPTVAQKVELNTAQKKKIARQAALEIKPDDFVYLDAGTTTGYMIECLEGTKAFFVTNGVEHARKLAQMGIRVSLLGGELKGSTEAVVGSQTIQQLAAYHFTKGFFGVNGITIKEGFTTPDVNEAEVKRMAMHQCRKCYVLADGSKFGKISPVTFGALADAAVITDNCPAEYRKRKNVRLI